MQIYNKYGSIISWVSATPSNFTMMNYMLKVMDIFDQKFKLSLSIRDFRK